MSLSHDQLQQFSVEDAQRISNQIMLNNAKLTKITRKTDALIILVNF